MRLFTPKSLIRLSILSSAVFLSVTGCKMGEAGGIDDHESDSLAIRAAFPTSPVLTPEQSMKKMQLEDGFTIRLVAAEPLVIAPVVINFDDQGRMWTIEMEGYMPDTSGTGEEKPNSRITILEDKNGDGVMDNRKVFMDGLVLPRAICIVENGLLVAEPPYLYYVENNNDVAGKKVLIDSQYAAGGNVEHQANGLYRGLDNWIYSANSSTRYRKAGKQWLSERTHSRGQWGISQDNFGRLYYNNNSQNAIGDYFPPGLGAANNNQKDVAGYKEKVVPNNKVYPARPTTGVNRGYQPGVLDDSLRLTNFTAASGPVVYRGDLFGAAYQQNLFVGEPSANLIKRNILTENGFKVEGKQAYSGKEFLSSLDERFRPVTLYNGPDGALYVVDMYRGIIQHKTYLTDYLKKEIVSRNLDQPLNYGRIYKIVPTDKKAKVQKMPGTANELVDLLQHPNGWVRDKAQQMLVDGKMTQAVPQLQKNLQPNNNPITTIHSMWTLEGLNALRPQDIISLLSSSEKHIQVQALTALAALINSSNAPQFLPALNNLANNKQSGLAPYIALTVSKIHDASPAAAKALSIKLLEQNPKDSYVADAVISSLKGREAAFLKEFTATHPDTTVAITKQLKKLLVDKKNAANTASFKDYPNGAKIFKTICQTCHGADGNGIKSLAPPLNNSELVTGSAERLAAIVLYGLSGPVKVNGKLYKAPEIAGEMPGIGNNKDFKDEDITEMLNLIRNSWSNKAPKISVEEIKKVRAKYPGRQKSFTMDELDGKK